jgi:hypothetical protein
MAYVFFGRGSKDSLPLRAKRCALSDECPNVTGRRLSLHIYYPPPSGSRFATTDYQPDGFNPCGNSKNRSYSVPGK